MNKKYTGIVSKGRFAPHDKEGFRLAFCNFEGKECEVVIKAKCRSKTRQYRYLYGVVYKLIAEEIGTTTDTVDDLMKRKFMFEMVMGARVPIRKKKMESVEFTQYINSIRNWAHDYFEGLYIPEPREVDH